ncbi:integrase family protein [Pseudomonas sp. G5(2012)]|nr:integrase family protein [Pseudomonas sp. G5(2012)]
MEKAKNSRHPALKNFASWQGACQTIHIRRKSGSGNTSRAHPEQAPVHDLRKTARPNFSTLTEPHFAEIMLGHKLPGSWQVYDQYDYLAEQKEAYSA